jgi:F0F1-type ATP synthase delta subunit
MAKTSRAKLAQGFVRLLEKQSVKHAVAALAGEIIAQKMTNQVDLLVSDIGRELLKTKGQLDVEVITARKLGDDVLNEVKALLQEATGAKRINLSRSIDPAIHGGLIARTADLELDLSIARKLKQLEI